jgi:hypothetical protein
LREAIGSRRIRDGQHQLDEAHFRGGAAALTILELTALVWAGSFAAGCWAHTGLGGEMIITPLLVLVFGVNIRYAAGAALVSVIATSTGAAAYMKEGVSNLRVAMLLEIATTAGAPRPHWTISSNSATWNAGYRELLRLALNLRGRVI